MPNLSKITREHDAIRNWAEERGAKPSHVKRTGSTEDVGILRFDFPGYTGEDTLEPISWEQFFEKFDERNLALVYEDETSAGQKSNFNKIISAETAAEAEKRSSGRGHKSTGSRKSAARSGARTAAHKRSAAASSKRSGNTTEKKQGGRKAAASKKSAGTRGRSSSAAKKSAAGRSGSKRSMSARSTSGRSPSRTKKSSPRTTARKATPKRTAKTAPAKRGGGRGRR